MANVLPGGARKNVWSFYRTRFLLAGSLALCASGLIALLALLPAYAALRAESAPVGEVLPVETVAQQGKGPERDQILRTRMLLDQFSLVASSSEPVFDALVSALDKRPRGVVVDRMEYTRGTGGEMVIGGAANSREGVNSYVAALRADSRWTSVSVPIGDLAGTGDGRFSITLSGTF